MQIHLGAEWPFDEKASEQVAQASQAGYQPGEEGDSDQGVVVIGGRGVIAGWDQPLTGAIPQLPHQLPPLK